jgi:hypothetical protein
MILDNRRELLIHLLIHLEAVIVGVIGGRRLIIAIEAVLDSGNDGMDEICRVYLLSVIIHWQIDIGMVVGDIILDGIFGFVFHIDSENIHPNIRMTRVSLFTIIDGVRRNFV